MKKSIIGALGILTAGAMNSTAVNATTPNIQPETVKTNQSQPQKEIEQRVPIKRYQIPSVRTTSARIGRTPKEYGQYLQATGRQVWNHKK